MPYQRIKFYQTGSFAVGNRLLPADLRSVQSSATRSNTLTCGHRACQGCGEALGARYALDAVMRATKGKMIAVNATGCLEVFSTPFPETSWQIAVAALAVRQRARGRHRRGRRPEGHGPRRHPGRRPGRRRRHGGHRHGLPVRHVRAERRRALHLLRQPGLHEHRRAAVRRHPARRAHRDHASRSAPSRATPSARARTSRSSPWRTRSRTWPPPRWPTCATWSTRRPGRWTSTGPATCTSWCRARSAGAARPPTRSRSPGSLSSRPCSPSSRPRPARWSARPRSAARCPSPTTCACRPATRTCSAPRSGRTSSRGSRPRPTATSPDSGCFRIIRNVRGCPLRRPRHSAEGR